jgi:hypothetical protein
MPTLTLRYPKANKYATYHIPVADISRERGIDVITYSREYPPGSEVRYINSDGSYSRGVVCRVARDEIPPEKIVEHEPICLVSDRVFWIESWRIKEIVKRG